jgi:hypothetical protein
MYNHNCIKYRVLVYVIRGKHITNLITRKLLHHECNTHNISVYIQLLLTHDMVSTFALVLIVMCNSAVEYLPYFTGK